MAAKTSELTSAVRKIGNKTLIDMHSLKPVDDATIATLAREARQ